MFYFHYPMSVGMGARPLWHQNRMSDIDNEWMEVNSKDQLKGLKGYFPLWIIFWWWLCFVLSLTCAPFFKLTGLRCHIMRKNLFWLYLIYLWCNYLTFVSVNMLLILSNNHWPSQEPLTGVISTFCPFPNSWAVFYNVS